MMASAKEAKVQHPLKEMRRSARSRVFLGGEIMLDAQFAPVECHIKNISEGGAGIVIQSGNLIPDRFTLFTRKTGQRHHAVVKHGKGRGLGVAFVSAATADRSWASISELRKIPVS